MMARGKKAGQSGFSLIELLVALGVFGIVSAAAFLLYTQHIRVFSVQQDLSGLNLNLRNAMTLIQSDLSNAGTGVFVGANIPNWPIGVTIENSAPGAACFDATTNTYGAGCFDVLHIVAAESTAVPVNPQDAVGNCVSTTTGSLFTQPGFGLTAAQTAAQFVTGDQILLVKGDGSQMTSVVLTGPGTVVGGLVRLGYTPTNADGTGVDPLFITQNANPRLGSLFCNTDWLIKLRPVTYSVNTANPNNPVLQRVQGAVADNVADQIIGFKVGATLWNGAVTSTEEYNYDAATYNTDGVVGSSAFDYTLLRSVRVSLIGRTVPNPDPRYTFRNTFDNGPYQILGVSVVVNPRNLSMRD